MDTNITIPKKEIAPGIFSTGGTATMPTVNPINNQPNAITSKALAPVVPIQGLPQTPVPTQPTQTTPTVSPFAGYLKDQELTQQEQQAQGLKDTGIDQYFKDLIGSQGEAQYRADEFAKTDYSANRKQLLNAENEWIRLEAEKNQDDITTARKLQQEELRDTLLPFAQMGQAKIQGDATMYRALKTAEQGVLTARQMALQGNLALASEEVERAVATKYAPFKERIATWEKMSTAIQPYLDSAEKKRLNVQNLKKDLAIKEIEKAEATEKDIEKLKLDYVIKTGDNRFGSKKYESIGEALTDMAEGLKKVDTSVVKLDSGATLLIDSNTGKTIRNLGGAKPTEGTITFPKNTPEQIKGLASVGSLVGGFSSVNAQKMFLKNVGDLVSQGNEKALAEKIIGQSLANLPDADTRKRVMGGFGIAKDLTRLQGLLNQYEASGGNTGFIKGNVQDIQQKFGQVGDPKLVSIGTQILNTLDNIVRQRTGAALTESEEKFYRKILPGTNKVGELNTALIDGLKTSLLVDVENNLVNNITTDGFSLVKSSLPDVFDNNDTFLNSFSGENLNKNLDNASFWKGL